MFNYTVVEGKTTDFAKWNVTNTTDLSIFLGRTEYFKFVSSKKS